MPYRTWLFIAAIGLTIVASSGQAQEQTESPSGQTDQEQGPVIPDIPTPFPVEIVEDDATADARKRSEQEARQREIADLAAQEGMNTATQAMNKATQRMAEYAFWSTVFVAIGTVLLIGTLVLTWMANRSAQAAVQVTRETGRDQARAYVEVSEVKFYWGNRHGSKPQFKIVISNHGQTPAKWFQIRQGYAVVERAGRTELEHFEDLPLCEDFGPTWNGINPTKNGMRASGPEIADWKEIKKCWRDPPHAKGMPPDNTHGVLVFGEIRYSTIFDEVFRSQFLFGAGTLESFNSDNAVEKEKFIEDDVTYTLTSVAEKPQVLGRNPLRLKLYEREYG
jgi:hypothetical protein